MKKISIRFVLLCLVALVAAGVSAQERKPKTDRYESPAPTKGLDQITPQVSEDILLRFVDEPSRHFGDARESYAKKDYAQAVVEIRKGAAFMHLERGRSTSTGNEALSDAAKQLEQLADDIENGSTGSVMELDRALGRAEQALAFHHEQKAEDFWRANNLGMAGWDLKAASINLKNSLKYIGGKVDPSTEDAIRDAGNVGQSLVDGANPKDERIGASMENLSDKIDEIGTQLTQPKK